jgi:aspartyl-tRNA(Asn)/glutamyl-tRNA(Gln) amidotransferase subunit C
VSDQEVDPRPPSGGAKLTTDDVAKVAQLALLDLDQDQLDRFTGQLAAIVELADRLEGFELDDVPPTAHPFGLTNVFRDDVAATGDEYEDMRRLALDGGPDIEDSRFKVPPALGEAP